MSEHPSVPGDLPRVQLYADPCDSVCACGIPTDTSGTLGPHALTFDLQVAARFQHVPMSEGGYAEVSLFLTPDQVEDVVAGYLDARLLPWLLRWPISEYLRRRRLRRYLNEEALLAM